MLVTRVWLRVTAPRIRVSVAVISTPPPHTHYSSGFATRTLHYLLSGWTGTSVTLKASHGPTQAHPGGFMHTFRSQAPLVSIRLSMKQ